MRSGLRVQNATVSSCLCMCSYGFNTQAPKILRSYKPDETPCTLDIETCEGGIQLLLTLACGIQIPEERPGAELGMPVNSQHLFGI